jgi:hypothetical protein
MIAPEQAQIEGIKTEEEEEDNDERLSNHCLAMRRAFTICRTKLDHHLQLILLNEQSPPTGTTKSDDDTIDSFVQNAGEIVFVPSTWKHKVVNSHHEETLSINRNWITWAQLPQMLQCLEQEMVAIQIELEA